MLGCVAKDRGRLVRLATGLLSDAALAEDAVQEASLKALAAAPGFRSEAAVCTWVQRICVNTCHDLLRRRQSRENLEAAVRRRALWEDPKYTVDPERVALSLERREVVNLAISRLTADQKQAVVLHDVEGWTGPEIASAMDWPLGTFKSHLRRGRQALVSLLAEERP